MVMASVKAVTVRCSCHPAGNQPKIRLESDGETVVVRVQMHGEEHMFVEKLDKLVNKSNN